MLKIPRRLHGDIIAHAIAGLPLEVCGILAGRDGTAQAIYRVTNTDASDTHFRMDLKEQYAVIQDLRRRGLKILAVYHSHPGTPARPSAEDIRWAQASDTSCLIISLMSPDTPVLKSFKISPDRVQRERVRIL